MRKIVHMYLASGVAEAGNRAGFSPGERHGMLVFLSSYTDNYDWKEAERVARENGWCEIEFKKAGKITRETIVDQDRTVRECFATALAAGSSMVAYAAREV